MDVLIGITTSFEEKEQRISHAYVEAIEQAGGVPILIPMTSNSASFDVVAELLHGLVITGGPAIVQGLIGSIPTDLSQTDPIRAQADEKAISAFEKKAKPMLGICYGMQLLNARAGGSIYADVQAQVEDTLVHSAKRGAKMHDIEIDTTSALYAALQKRSVKVNSRHIQAIATVGSSFRVTAVAPDGVPEAIENEDGSIMGVQFHPENLGEAMLPLFKQFIHRARTMRSPDTSILQP